MSEENESVFQKEREAFNQKQEEIKRRRNALLDERRNILERHVNRLIAKNLKNEDKIEKSPVVEYALDGSIIIRFDVNDKIIK